MNTNYPKSISGRINALVEQMFDGDAIAFSEAAGISPSFLEMLLQPHAPLPDMQVFQSMASRLCVGFTWLVTGDGEEPYRCCDSSTAEKISAGSLPDCVQEAEEESDENLTLPLMHIADQKADFSEFCIGRPFRGIGLAYEVRGQDALLRTLIHASLNKGWGTLLVEDIFGKQTAYLQQCFHELQQQGLLPREACFRTINFTEQIYSDRVNPLQECYVRSMDEARETAASFLGIVYNTFRIEGDFNRFRPECESLLAAMFWFLLRLRLPVDDHGHLQEGNVLPFADENDEVAPVASCGFQNGYVVTGCYASLPHAFALLRLNDNELAELLCMCPQSRKEIEGMLCKDTYSFSRIARALRDVLACFDTPKIWWVLSGDDFDLNLSMPNRPVCLSLSQSLIEEGNPNSALSAFLLDRIVTEQDRKHPEDLPCSILLSAYPQQVAKRLKLWLTRACFNRVSWTVGLRSFVELAASVGEHGATNLFRLFGTVIASPTTDCITAGWLSRHVFIDGIASCVSLPDTKDTLDDLLLSQADSKKVGFFAARSSQVDGTFSSLSGMVDLKGLFMENNDLSDSLLKDTPLHLFPDGRQSEKVYIENYDRICSDVLRLCELLLRLK